MQDAIASSCLSRYLAFSCKTICSSCQSQYPAPSGKTIASSCLTRSSALSGKTRMQGNALVRTVSGLTSSAPPAKRSRLTGGGSFVTAPGVTSAVQRQIANRKRPVLQTASGLGGNVIQEFHRSHPISTVPTMVVQQQARPTQCVVF